MSAFTRSGHSIDQKSAFAAGRFRPKGHIEESQRGRRAYKKGDQSSLAGFLLQCPIDVAGFAPVPQVPFVQLGDNFLDLPCHGLEAPLSAAVNGVGTFKRDHIAIPVGVIPTGRRLCSPDRYDLVGLCHLYAGSVRSVCCAASYKALVRSLKNILGRHSGLPFRHLLIQGWFTCG